MTSTGDAGALTYGKPTVASSPAPNQDALQVCIDELVSQVELGALPGMTTASPFTNPLEPLPANWAQQPLNLQKWPLHNSCITAADLWSDEYTREDILEDAGTSWVAAHCGYDGLDRDDVRMMESRNRPALRPVCTTTVDQQCWKKPLLESHPGQWQADLIGSHYPSGGVMSPSPRQVEEDPWRFHFHPFSEHPLDYPHPAECHALPSPPSYLPATTQNQGNDFFPELMTPSSEMMFFDSGSHTPRGGDLSPCRLGATSRGTNPDMGGVPGWKLPQEDPSGQAARRQPVPGSSPSLAGSKRLLEVAFLDELCAAGPMRYWPGPSEQSQQGRAGQVRGAHTIHVAPSYYPEPLVGRVVGIKTNRTESTRLPSLARSLSDSFRVCDQENANLKDNTLTGQVVTPTMSPGMSLLGGVPVGGRWTPQAGDHTGDTSMYGESCQRASLGQVPSLAPNMNTSSSHCGTAFSPTGVDKEGGRGFMDMDPTCPMPSGSLGSDGLRTLTPPTLKPGRVPQRQSVMRDDLKKVWHLPIKEAARYLEVGVSSLKKLARHLGIERWPYRKLKSVERMVTTLGEWSRVEGYGPEQAPYLQHAMRELENEWRVIYNDPNQDLSQRTKRLAQDIAKTVYKSRQVGGSPADGGTTTTTTTTTSSSNQESPTKKEKKEAADDGDDEAPDQGPLGPPPSPDLLEHILRAYQPKYPGFSIPLKHVMQAGWRLA